MKVRELLEDLSELKDPEAEVHVMIYDKQGIEWTALDVDMEVEVDGTVRLFPTFPVQKIPYSGGDGRVKLGQQPQ